MPCTANNNLRTSQAGKNFTKKSEGLMLTAYPDPQSKGAPYTNGYGHTGSDVFKGQVINVARANQWFEADILKVELQVKRLVNVALTQYQFDALVDFVFNLGSSRFMNSTLLKLINANDMISADKEFVKWEKNALAGTILRRNCETSIFAGKGAAGYV